MIQDSPTIAIACYREDEWPLWKHLCDDGESFFAEPFRDWKRRVDALVAEKRREGLRVRLVELSFEQFLEWTKASNRRLDSQSRAEFAGLQKA